MYDDSSSEKVEADIESDKGETDSEIDRYYQQASNASSRSFESQGEHGYFSQNNTVSQEVDQAEEEEDEEEDQIQEEDAMKNETGEDQSPESDDLADILNKQIQIGLQNRDELNAIEKQKREKAQKKFENTVKRGLLEPHKWIIN